MKRSATSGQTEPSGNDETNLTPAAELRGAAADQNSSTPGVRFGLRRLLMLIAIVALAFGLLTQIGMGQAEFRVLRNGLSLNDDDRWEGVLECGYLGSEHQSPTPWPFNIDLQNFSNDAIGRVQPKHTFTIRYRAVPLWPLKAQDPFAMFLGRLGIPADQIVGYVEMSDETVVLVDGFSSNSAP